MKRIIAAALLAALLLSGCAAAQDDLEGAAAKAQAIEIRDAEGEEVLSITDSEEIEDFVSALETESWPPCRAAGGRQAALHGGILIRKDGEAGPDAARRLGPGAAAGAVRGRRHRRRAAVHDHGARAHAVRGGVPGGASALKSAEKIKRAGRGIDSPSRLALPVAVKSVTTARVTLPLRRQRVQAYTCLGLPSTMALTRFTFGFQVRLERLWEWLTLMPKAISLPQNSHFAICEAPPFPDHKSLFDKQLIYCSRAGR